MEKTLIENEGDAFKKQMYADTYVSLYRMNRQEAGDYITQVRKLAGKETAMEVIQLAAEKSLKMYRLNMKSND